MSNFDDECGEEHILYFFILVKLKVGAVIGEHVVVANVNNIRLGGKNHR